MYCGLLRMASAVNLPAKRGPSEPAAVCGRSMLPAWRWTSQSEFECYMKACAVFPGRRHGEDGVVQASGFGGVQSKQTRRGSRGDRVRLRQQAINGLLQEQECHNKLAVVACRRFRT